MYKGEFEIEVGGKKRGLKFGTLANAMFCESEGLKPKDIQQRVEEDHPFVDIDFTYYAACAYCRLKGINVDFTKDDVSCWIDEIGKARLAEMLMEAFKVFVPKNVIPPTQGEPQMNGVGKNTQPSESENVG